MSEKYLAELILNKYYPVERTIFRDGIINAMMEYGETISSQKNRSYYQLCPKCNGEGQVSNMGSTSSLLRVCPVCDGNRTLFVKDII